MDNNHFSPPYNPYSQSAPPNSSSQPSSNQASFGALSASGHPQASPTHATLPPLQGHNAGFPQFGSLSYSHLGNQPQGSAQPQHSNPNSGINAAAAAADADHVFSHTSPGTNPGSMLPPGPFANPYSMPQSLQAMYASSSGASIPPSTAPAGLPAIRPMPSGVVGGAPNGPPGLASAGQLGPMGQQPQYLQADDAPTHVVGSQGRRGILPSAPGRPNAPTQGNAQSSKSMIPQKDADGKYPCPHCNKTYLHAKHLKRHLLRHTGDRPYMCHLCKDTFSRSDILKRHFQKCSLRRGNPTGANHLAHQRRNTNSSNRLSISQQDGPIGLASLPEVAGTAAYNGNMVATSPTADGDISTRTSRANSLITPGNMSHRNSVAGLGILASNAPSNDTIGTSASYQPPMNSYTMHNTTNSGPMPSNYAYNVPHLNGNIFNNSNNPQQMPFLGLHNTRFNSSPQNNLHPPMPNGDGNGSQIDWSRVFTHGGQNGYIGGQPMNASPQGMNDIKTKQEDHTDFYQQNDFRGEPFLGGIYSHDTAFDGGDFDGGLFGFPNWSTDNLLQAKVGNLIQQCFPEGAESARGNLAAELVLECLKVENVKHFVEHYTSFHGHWALLHIPTFKLTEANNNLVLTIICIGAIYSPRLGIHQVRQMMDFVKATVFRSCRIYSRTINGQSEDIGNDPAQVEELLALTMLQIIFTWHGDPTQRELARGEFPVLVRIAKAMGLYQAVPPGHYAYSALHFTPSSQGLQSDANAWGWHGWLEQEKRNRVLYSMIMMDSALVLYFNCIPQFDLSEVRLMLPADDPAWDASDEQECADVLGLNGSLAQGKNTTGTRRLRQLTIREAMRTLLDPGAAFQTRATNAYSKFILIHALIVRIVACQKLLLLPGTQLQGFNFNLNAVTPGSPLSPSSGAEQHSGGVGVFSTPKSGQGSPAGRSSPSSKHAAAVQERKRLSQALEKWKRIWDQDIELQYPSSQTQHQRRFGFSRDGVHFFYLGRSFLQSQRPADWELEPDVRFQKVMALLKRIKSIVALDTEMSGQDIGSVGDIDDQYGLDSLTLDMKLLFKPYDSQVDSPVSGVRTH